MKNIIAIIIVLTIYTILLAYIGFFVITTDPDEGVKDDYVGSPSGSNIIYCDSLGCRDELYNPE